MKSKEFEKDDIKDYLEQMNNLEHFESFDVFYEFINKIRTIKINEDNWKLSKCNCCYWLKNYICNHVIIIAVDLEKCLFPDKAKNIPIPKNKKRGRKARTTKARDHQKDIGNQFARLSKSDCEDHSDNTPDHLERIFGKKRCRSADETRNDADEDALNDNDGNNYSTTLANFEVIAVQSITTVAPTPLTTTTATAATIWSALSNLEFFWSNLE